MAVIIDGVTVKQFGSNLNAANYAATMMRKCHDVWVISKQVAHRLEFI